MVLGVAAEEMLHWALVQNLLTAVGSAPYVARPCMPHQAKGFPAGVQFRLLPFGEDALRHFVYLERPEGMDLADAAGFEAVGAPLPPMDPTEVIAHGQESADRARLIRFVLERGPTIRARAWAGRAPSGGAPSPGVAGGPGGRPGR